MAQYGNSNDPEHQGIRNWENKRGGVQHVTGDDTIGQPGRCWCGDQDGHDWPGKADGEPHPREGKH